MKYNRILPILFALLLLTGCQLALPDAAESSSEDRLIGMLMTAEPLELPPAEIPLETTWNGEIAVDEEAWEKQRRIYATLVTETTTDDNGHVTTHPKYCFEGLDTPMLFTALVSNGQEEYYASGTDGMDDVHHGIAVYDDREELNLSGTVHVWPATTDHVVEFHPVYQQADGQVYAVVGGSIGFAIGEGNRSEGETFREKTESSTKLTQNGKTTEMTSVVDVGISVMFRPVTVTVQELDADSNLLNRTEYEAGNLPETITLHHDADYLIVETDKVNADGEPVVTRELLARGEESLTAYYAREDGFCIPQITTLLWP